MAKKKVNHQAQGLKQGNPPQESQTKHQDQNSTQTKSLTHRSSMEDPAEKLQNLKSLNSMLLKETFEKRQQIESLVQAKEALESELSQCGSERKELEALLARDGEKNLGFELERSLVCVFVKTQMREMCGAVDRLVKEKSKEETQIGFLRSEVNRLGGRLENESKKLNRVCQERDLARSDLDVQVEEANELRGRVVEMEEKERKTDGEYSKLKKEFGKLMEKREEQENVIKEIVKERDLSKKNLQHAVNEADNLKRHIEAIEMEKNEVEKKKIGQDVRIDELEKEIGRLNEIVSRFSREEKVMRKKILELENSCSEAMEKEKEMATQINALVQDKREKERSVENLKEEKVSISVALEKAMLESGDMRREMEILRDEGDAARKDLEKNRKVIDDMEKKIAELFEKKNELEKAKIKGDEHNAELLKKVSDLNDNVSKLQEACRNHENSKNELISEVRQMREAFDTATIQKDDALTQLEEEKVNTENLISKISEIERTLEKTTKELSKLKTERDSLGKGKKEMESQFELLSKDNDRLKKDLSEAKRSVSDLMAEMESTGINYERALSLLKTTASSICQSKDDSVSYANEVDLAESKFEDVKPYTAELEAIKKAFRNKEKMVQDMKLQVEEMQKSITAEKRKNFWTVLSSATTIFAAASIAYVARLR